MNNGFTLTGALIASNITEGKTRDEGTPYCRRTAVISTGPRVFEYSESCDPTQTNKPYPTDGRLVQVDVEWATTDKGTTRVRGELKFVDKK